MKFETIENAEHPHEMVMDPACTAGVHAFAGCDLCIQHTFGQRGSRNFPMGNHAHCRLCICLLIHPEGPFELCRLDCTHGDDAHRQPVGLGLCHRRRFRIFVRISQIIALFLTSCTYLTVHSDFVNKQNIINPQLLYTKTPVHREKLKNIYIFMRAM